MSEKSLCFRSLVNSNLLMNFVIVNEWKFLNRNKSLKLIRPKNSDIVSIERIKNQKGYDSIHKMIATKPCMIFIKETDSHNITVHFNAPNIMDDVDQTEYDHMAHELFLCGLPDHAGTKKVASSFAMLFVILSRYEGVNAVIQTFRETIQRDYSFEHDEETGVSTFVFNTHAVKDVSVAVKFTFKLHTITPFEFDEKEKVLVNDGLNQLYGDRFHSKGFIE